jgi:O-antigen ligase
MEMTKTIRFGDVASLAAFIVFCAVVAAAPLPMGSAEPATIAFWCSVLGATAILASLLEFRRPQLIFAGLVGVLGAAYAIVLHEQLSASPWLADPHPIWKQTADLLGVPVQPSVSIARNQPWSAIGAPLAALLSFLCGLILCANRTRAHQLLRVIAWTGAAYAIYGIQLALVDPATMVGRVAPIPLTSTFINRNTAVDYFGACSAIWLLFVCEGIRRRMPDDRISWRSVIYRRVWSARLIVPLTMMFVCLLATFMTNSKAGGGLSLISFIVAVVGFFYRDLPGRRGVFFAVGAGCSVALLSLQLLAGNVVARFSEQGLIDHTRLSLYRSAFRMIADHPWFGTGLGTFVWAFPPYRNDDVSMYGIYDRAHNTLLEIAVEAGVPLAGLVVIGWMIALAVLVHGVRNRRRDRIIPAAALSVALLAVLHSLVDFSLQIPGFAIVVFGLLGAGIAQSFRSES